MIVEGLCVGGVLVVCLWCVCGVLECGSVQKKGT